MTNDNVMKIQEALDNLLESKNGALPSGFNRIRFLQNCKEYLRGIKDIDKHKDEDVAQLLFNGAVLGLDFLNNECHVIIEGNSIKFQTDYKGEKKLTKKYSVRPILDIYAKNVREGDEFREEVTDGRPTVYFLPQPFNNSKIIGSFAVALFADGGMVYETISTDEIESIRKHYGKNPSSDSWEKSQGEMYKRTVLRRLCKNIEIEFDAEQTLAFDAGSEFEFNRDPRPQQQSPLNILEVSEVATDETNQE